MARDFTLTIDSLGIAHLVFDSVGEKVNTLTKALLKDLSELFLQIYTQSEIRALVISSAKENNFFAGAHVKEVASITSKKEIEELVRLGQNVFFQLEQLPLPTIAVIDGACLGGGLELALSCTYRLATDHPKTQLGLPEIKLGIIPGWGGTQRLTNLIGLTQSLKMIVSGKAIPAYKAMKMHLVDALAPCEFLSKYTVEFLQKIFDPEERKKILERRHAKKWIEKVPFASCAILSYTKRQVQKKSSPEHYPAPLYAIKAIGSALKNNGSGYEEERRALSDLAFHPTTRHLLQLFSSKESLKGDVSVKNTRERTAVIGAGVMGGAIAWQISEAKLPVILKDISWDAISKGLQEVQEIGRRMPAEKRRNHNEAMLQFHRITGTLDYAHLKSAQIVIEAVVENVEIKKLVFAELEKYLPEDALICSNTSSLTISELQEGMQHPQRMTGMHFFNPVPRMPLVEIIAGKKSSPAAVQEAYAFAKTLGKTPIIVKDCPGFLVNRILVIGMLQAIELVAEGVPIHQLDQALLKFGMPMGFCALTDTIGIDVAYKVAKILEKAYGTRMQIPEGFRKLFEAKLWGKKTGNGFYLYKGKEVKPNPAALAYFGVEETAHNISEEGIIERVLYAMLGEAVRCLEEEVVKDPALVDMALLMGTGFPPFRGGLLRYADDMGTKALLQKLEKYAARYGAAYTPCELLRKKGEKNDSFY